MQTASTRRPMMILLGLLAISLAGCGASSDHVAAQEAKVLALLGDVEVANLNLDAGDGSPAAFEKLGDFFTTLKAAPSTVAGKVGACREHPGGAHCEFLLAEPVPMDEAAIRQMGTPDATGQKRYSFHSFESDTETVTYGNLQLGVAEGSIVAVEVLR